MVGRNFIASTTDVYFKALDRLVEQFAELEYLSVGTVAMTAATSMASVAYIVWTIRTGYLTASMLASLPAWMRLDPLPVLDFVRANSQGSRNEKVTDVLTALRDELPASEVH
jgi:hypothetical protein